MELHRLRASQVSAAQPLKIIYYRKQKLSNEFLVVVLVYASQINIIQRALSRVCWLGLKRILILNLSGDDAIL